MDKKLPKVFVNNIGNIKNNDDVYYENNHKIISNNSVNNDNFKITKLNKNDINYKINQIFASSNYVYKAEVILKTNKGKFNKKIIGRNKNYLITMDNEIINIDDIIDIEF